ncbi:alkaline phosphatase family protein [Alteromonas sp. KUL49]|uniref:alkaline phosphatase family protein n=1 Tax=Alteromonas sp. KUL49 TaxID=2480798 RepID=UPI00102EDF79|nr:alkaline phosphatase family protein [Alteromonas sp. KUL49]TAP34958.1 alkaline phosphatase family protein [Alteromonas sp. KUL49]GEA13501.1 hypothetical protein KUL49_38760 [Alteromonas sp. KUL49]
MVTKNNIKEGSVVIFSSSLPAVIAGPIVRHVSATSCHLWLVTSKVVDVDVLLAQNGIKLETRSSSEYVSVGEFAHIYLLSVTPTQAFTPNEPISYDIQFADDGFQEDWQKYLPRLLYKGEPSLSFRWVPSPTKILHGSCRKPHHKGGDALAQVDNVFAEANATGNDKPDILFMTGDQIYADDVAGPMLQAIQQTISMLGLTGESIEGATVSHSDDLPNHVHNYYEREQLLPQIATNTLLASMFFGAKKKPVFTSVNAKNHLISCNEIIAMYLLVWSPVLWENIKLSSEKVPDIHQGLFDEEQKVIENFVEDLPRVQRVLAHIPSYMIFDDHDVTDDWNLTRGWEQEVYNNPFSKRMIGNALTGYLLCQGWGNAPTKVAPLINQAKQVFQTSSLKEQDEFIQTLLHFEQWDYRLDTTPPIAVLDTRTRRWRSESSLNKPSGLMDWEALCDFQQGIIGKEAVIVISAAPIYGVKFIEAIQKVFTFFGKALTVDAENWMAHQGTANVMLNIFTHYNTPPEFIILSGDVHYSFVYDVRLRYRKNSPHITQFTCSGMKNAFPDKLIKTLDRINRALYGPSSLLNIFTRRRNMTVKARKPAGSRGELLNGSAIGLLELSPDNHTVLCKALMSDGKEVEFPPIKEG